MTITGQDELGLNSLSYFEWLQLMHIICGHIQLDFFGFAEYESQKNKAQKFYILLYRV